MMIFRIMLAAGALGLAVPVTQAQVQCSGQNCLPAPSNPVEACTGQNCLPPEEQAAKECKGQDCAPIPEAPQSPEIVKMPETPAPVPK